MERWARVELLTMKTMLSMSVERRLQAKRVNRRKNNQKILRTTRRMKRAMMKLAVLLEVDGLM